MLKKIAVSICAGVLLLAGASAYAATSSLVGQKVQGLFAIKKDGIKIADAVIINGTAYAPVRAVSEATGASLTVEGKEIIMKESTQAANSSAVVSPSSTPAPTVTAAQLQSEIDKRLVSIQYIEKFEVDVMAALIKENPNSSSVTQWKESLAASTAEIDRLKNEVTDLQKQLAELQN